MEPHTSHRIIRADFGGSMEHKLSKQLDDRLDSGLDSLQEEEYLSLQNELGKLDIQCTRPSVQPDDHAWKHETTEDGDTYLHLTIIHEAEAQAEQIIKECVNDPFLNQQNHQKQTALHLAVITEQPRLVEKLLKAGCDPQLVDQNGNTALHIACRRGALACFSVLTQTNTKHLRTILSSTNYSGQTCLHIAAICGYLFLVESLVQLGADINAKEQCSGRTSLHLAVDLQNLNLVQQLIALGADVNSETYSGHVPYHLTFGRLNGEIQRQLYERTAFELRELPDSESESEEEHISDDDCTYDDFQFGGK